MRFIWLDHYLREKYVYEVEFRFNVLIEAATRRYI